MVSLATLDELRAKRPALKPAPEPTPFKLYVCGPMSGYPNFNREAFAKATAGLEAAGYEAVNPAPFHREGYTWADYLKRDLPLMLACDGVATLPDWDCSKGASLEVYVAQQVDIQVLPVARWLEKANPAQCANACWGGSLSAPERCALPEWHEGKCEP